MKASRDGLVLSFWLAIMATQGWSQFQKQSFERLAEEQELSTLRTYDIVQDGFGFLWIGTMSGLGRYDGKQFRPYEHHAGDTASISPGPVFSLAIDDHSQLWAGTFEGGLNRFDPRTERFIRYLPDDSDPTSLSGGVITAIAFREDGTTYVATRGNGLNIASAQAGSGTPEVEKLKWIRYTHDPSDPASLSSDTVRSLLCDSQKRLWVGTEGGLDLFDPATETFTHYRHHALNKNSLDDNRIHSIYEDASSVLWVGTFTGLTRFDEKAGTFVRYTHQPDDPHSIGPGEVSSILEEDGRFLWVSTLQSLNYLDRVTGEFTRYLHDPTDRSTISSNYIRKIRRDRSGVIWLATESGLTKINRLTRLIRHYRYSKEMSTSQNISAIAASRKSGALWLGTWSRGLVRIVEGRTTFFNHEGSVKRSLNDDFVMTIFEDRSGTLWVGTQKGLDRLDEKTGHFHHYFWSQNKDTSSIFSIAEDHAGNLWLSTTEHGLIRFDPTTATSTRYMHDPANPQSLSSNAVRGLLIDSKGTLWIGTEHGGLNAFDPTLDAFRHFKHDSNNPGSIASDLVYLMYEGRDNTMWVKTGRGLNRMDMLTRRFATIVLDTTRSVTPQGILEDHQGRLWVSTLENGIYMFDPRTGERMNLGVHDGLQGSTFSLASIRHPTGELIFGGVNGFNMFNPDSLSFSRPPPPPVVTQIRIFDKPVNFGLAPWALDRLSLPYNQNFLSFDFACLDYSAPEKNRISYSLAGLDKNWTMLQGGNRAFYTDIQPGEYTLFVKTYNSHGIWSEQPLALPITITPPFWQTTWFRGLMGLLVIGLLTAAYNYRVHQLLQVERMRLKIADDLHDDIGSMLSTIRLRIDLVKKHLPEHQTADTEHLSVAGRVALQTADSLRNLVWMLNPEHDQTVNIIARMRDAAARLLVNIEHSFDADERTSMPVTDMGFRRNLILFYQEALNNIVKHSRATRVAVAVQVSEKWLNLIIEDNGTGFDPGAASRGHGLNTLKHRAGEMGGSAHITSSPGNGTRVHLSAPIAEPPLVVRLKISALKRVRDARSALTKVTSLWQQQHDGDRDVNRSG